MGDLINVFQTLAGTPVPNILLILGSVLIVLGFIGKVSTVIEVAGPARVGLSFLAEYVLP